ncbi:class I adenylate-forming enzyme family protein [Marinicella sp. W31]|uniref:class I adenylate-forming enzyme family protein n=1 Tax=Marinicella sp. W31 TaxID=3023713 RepID=UPI00375801A2
MKYDLLTHIRNSRQIAGNKTALIFEKQNYSYEKLDSMISNTSRLMYSDGFGKTDRVVICCGNRVETVVSFWAVAELGGCISVISDEQSPELMKYILNDCDAKVLVIRGDLLEQLSQHKLEETQLNKIIVTETSADDRLPSLGTIELVRFEELATAEMPEFNVISEDIAALIYTSGSTGQPKGVTLSHANMMCALDSLNTYLGNREEDVFLNVLPLSFDYGLYQMIMCYSKGATLVLEKNLIWPLQLLKAIQEYQVTVLPGVPAVFDLIEKFGKLSKFNLDSVRYVSNTGAALMGRHFEIIQKHFKNAAVFSMYGLTECKRCTYLPPEFIDTKRASVGVAIPNTEISVINETGGICEPHEIGQLVVRGGTVMQGYWNKPEKTAEKIGPHPIHGGRCLFTGDYGYLDEDGFFYFKGRIDEVVKIRGMKVLPLEIEAYLIQHESIGEAAIIAIEHGDRDPEIVAFVETSDAMAELEVQRFCKKQLKAYQIPERIYFLKKMPRNTNGKIDKPELRLLLENLDSEQQATV